VVNKAHPYLILKEEKVMSVVHQSFEKWKSKRLLSVISSTRYCG